MVASALRLNMNWAASGAFACLVLALTLSGCASSASWATLYVAPNYQRPRTVTLKVSDATASGDVMTLEMALVDELGKRDIHATPLDDENSPPTLRVVIEKWKPGSESARTGVAASSALLTGVNMGGLAEGEVAVKVEALGADGLPAIQGILKGWVDQAPEHALRAIADRIASIVATGEVTSSPPPAARHTGYP